MARSRRKPEPIHITAEQIERAEAEHAELERRWQEFQPVWDVMAESWRRINEKEMGPDA